MEEAGFMTNTPASHQGERGPAPDVNIKYLNIKYLNIKGSTSSNHLDET